jgi:hypothetical protein
MRINKLILGFCPTMAVMVIFGINNPAYAITYTKVSTGGTASASSYLTSYEASKAFDGSSSTYWMAYDAYTSPLSSWSGVLKYQLSSSYIVTRYRIQASGSYAPRAWKFEGSTTGNSWVTLDTKSVSAWGTNEWREYTFNNATSYQYYRINVSLAYYDGSYAPYYYLYSVQIQELELYSPATPTATISASPATFYTGGSSTLTWSTTNATSVSISPNVGSVAVSGSVSVSPPATTTYTLTATGAGGVANSSATITMNPNYIKVSAGGTASGSGGTDPTTTPDKAFDASSSTLWFASAQDVYPWLRYQLSSPRTVTKYRMQCASGQNDPTAWKLQGSSNGTTWVDLDTRSVSAWSANEWREFNFTNQTPYQYYRILPTQAYYWSYGGTTIYAVSIVELELYSSIAISATFSASPTVITVGHSSTLTWITENATSVSITPGIGTVALNGSVVVSPTIVTTYTLTAAKTGSSVTKYVTVTAWNENVLDVDDDGIPDWYEIQENSDLDEDETGGTCIGCGPIY